MIFNDKLPFENNKNRNTLPRQLFRVIWFLSVFLFIPVYILVWLWHHT